MKFSEYDAARRLELLPSWEDSLKKRQEELSGVPSDECLVDNPACEWPRSLRRSRLIVAAMCLAEHECAACLNLLRKL